MRKIFEIKIKKVRLFENKKFTFFTTLQQSKVPSGLDTMHKLEGSKSELKKYRLISKYEDHKIFGL